MRPLPLRLLPALGLCLMLHNSGGCSSSSLNGSPFNPDLGSTTDMRNQDVPIGQQFYPIGYPVGGGQRELAIADLDGNKKPEIIATLPYNGQIAIVWNPGTQQASISMISTPGTPYGLVAAKLDGDDIPDLAFTDQAAGTLNIFYTKSVVVDRNDPFSSKQTVMYALSPGVSVVRAGLLDKNDSMDLAVLNTKDGTVSVFTNLGAPGMYGFKDRTTRVFPGPLHYSMVLLAGRIDRAADVLVTSASDDTLTVLRNGGDGDLALDTQAQNVISTMRGPVFVTTGGPPGQKDAPVYVAASASNQIQRWESTAGRLRLTDTIEVAPRPVALAVDKIDADLTTDLVVASSNRDELEVLLSTPGGVYTSSPNDRIATGQAPVAIAIEDLNMDGCSDLIVAAQQSNLIQVFFSGVRPTCQAQP